MVQLHKRFSDEQVRVLLEGYCQGVLSAGAVHDYLDIGRSRFFALVKEYRGLDSNRRRLGVRAAAVGQGRRTRGRASQSERVIPCCSRPLP
jgi:hypothetical protein